MSEVSMSREEIVRKILNGEFDDYHLIHKDEVVAEALKIKRLEIERNLAIGEENAAKAKCDAAVEAADKFKATIEDIRILADTALRDWDVFRIVEAMKQIHAKAKEVES